MMRMMRTDFGSVEGGKDGRGRRKIAVVEVVFENGFTWTRDGDRRGRGGAALWRGHLKMLKGWSRHLLVHGHAHLMKVTSRVCRSRRRAVYQSAITPTPIGPHYPPSTTTIIPRPITIPTTTTTGDSHKQNV